ncbi:MAG: hypothetical protein K8R59_02640 [Thermoanaerobaculales bacterium]|nr:hypothetical protein [Thermoanaerobaculales bacterium]
MSIENLDYRSLYVGVPLEALPTAGDVSEVMAELFDFCAGSLFADGFESGNYVRWSSSVP